MPLLLQAPDWHGSPVRSYGPMPHEDSQRRFGNPPHPQGRAVLRPAYQ